MNRSRWLQVIALAGMAIFAFSFVDGWIAHDREVRGEGYRYVQTTLNAWRSVSLPILTGGVLIALGVAVGAIVSVLRTGLIPVWALLAGSVLALVLIGASIVPIEQDGHASSVDLSAGWLSGVGIGLAALMVVAAARLARPSPRSMLALGILAAVTLAGAGGGRWLGLQWKEGTGRHWAEGSYVRPPTDGLGEQTLTIDDGRFTISERWAGTWESSGWTVVLDGDPACPDSRGAYHAHSAGESGADLRFVKVVDTCHDGARAADLETGIWERVP